MKVILETKVLEERLNEELTEVMRSCGSRVRLEQLWQVLHYVVYHSGQVPREEAKRIDAKYRQVVTTNLNRR